MARKDQDTQRGTHPAVSAGTNACAKAADATTPAFLLSDLAVAELLSVGRSTVWDHVKAGHLPRPIKIGGLTRWRRDEILEALDRATERRNEVVEHDQRAQATADARRVRRHLPKTTGGRANGQ